MTPETLANLAYLLSSVLFVFGLKQLGRVKTARQGNTLAAAAMLFAVIGTLVELGTIDYRWIIIGVLIGGAIGTATALKVEMTSMPELVAIFNGFGGASSALVAIAVFYVSVERGGDLAATITAPALLGADDATGAVTAVTSMLSVFIGALTFSGSIIAYMKLNGSLKKGQPILLPARHLINIALIVAGLGSIVAFSATLQGVATLTTALFALTGISLLLGILLVIPIGGADMPVVVSLLNSYSGLAASAAGFVTGNPSLVIAGAMVGAAGLILTNLMCKAMNRSLLNVLVGGFGETGGGGDTSEYTNVKSSGAEEAAMILEGASSVVFVPGYGLAVAQAQHAVKELAAELEKNGAEVRYCIHPVAGRMPGHMNVLLAEADVPYEQLVELDLINGDFRTTDVAIVIGANDVANPSAIEDPQSPIAGMPIANVHEARTVFVVKRSLSPGYAGIKNPLFERDNTMMLFGDAKKMVQQMTEELRQA
ncbi:MAG: NAD(P)(+) transhydrogenase (Re/Si-specific) subunit beta [Myxococcota bacterium]